MTPDEFAEALSLLLTESSDDMGAWPAGIVPRDAVRTLRDAGYLTNDPGLAVPMSDGSTFLITVQRRN